MAKLMIRGGKSLNGEVKINGAKNSVLPMIAATLLTDEECTLHNCPNITDVHSMLKIMQSLGSDYNYQNGVITIHNKNTCKFTVPAELARELRSSIFLLGPVLAKCRKAILAYPGGCDIGVRPVDIHLKGLIELGVKVEESHGMIYCDGLELKGGDVIMDFPSVGATENLMMAGCMAKGCSRIRNAAKEPEIVDLQNFINAMGGKIKGAGGSVIEIEGVEKLHGCEFVPIPDRIVSGTILIAGAVCGGDITLQNCSAEHLRSLLFKLGKTACNFDYKNDTIRIQNNSKLKAIDLVETQPYPGFPTDLQSQMMALMTVSEGTGVIVENVFETRFKPVRELLKMGAKITVKDRAAIITGVKQLEGALVTAGDLRGGAALAIAGMKAVGYTVIDDIHHIDRGYERFEHLFSSLGADIKRF